MALTPLWCLSYTANMVDDDYDNHQAHLHAHNEMRRAISEDLTVRYHRLPRWRRRFVDWLMR